MCMTDSIVCNVASKRNPDATKVILTSLNPEVGQYYVESGVIGFTQRNLTTLLFPIRVLSIKVRELFNPQNIEGHKNTRSTWLSKVDYRWPEWIKRGQVVTVTSENVM